MANINGNGIPGRNTPGAIGDIYTDSKTGRKFKCVFAYRSGDTGDFDCEWKEIATKPLEKMQQKKENVTAPVKEEPPKPKRTDYSAYSKKNS